MITCTWRGAVEGEACECPAVWVFVSWGGLPRTVNARCSAHCAAFERAVVRNDPSRRGSSYGRVPTYPFPQAGPVWAAFSPAVWARWLRLVRVRRYFEGESVEQFDHRGGSWLHV